MTLYYKHIAQQAVSNSPNNSPIVRKMSVPSGSAVRQVQWLIYVLLAFQAAPAALSEESNESLMLSLQYRNARDMREMFADVKTLIVSQAQQASDMKTLIARQAQQISNLMTRLDSMEANQAQQTSDLMARLDSMDLQLDTIENATMARADTIVNSLDTMETTEAPQYTTTMNTLCIEGCEGNKSGLEKIFAVDSLIPVPCDGQGWAVIQRRVDGAFNFPTRTWDEYKVGFGDKEGSFWLGLETIHRLTSASPAMLRVELTSFKGETRYAQYTSFRIEGEEAGYRIHVSGYSGTAGDSLTWHDGMKFSTIDRDQDAASATHCAKRFFGGWWYNSCFISNLNSMYRPTGRGPADQSILWYGWLGGTLSYKTVAMKLRFV